MERGRFVVEWSEVGLGFGGVKWGVVEPGRAGCDVSLSLLRAPLTPLLRLTLPPSGSAHALCRAPRQGVDIEVPSFTVRDGCTYGALGCSPFLRLLITTTGDAEGSGMQILIDLEPHQRKTVFIGMRARPP